MLPLVWRQLLRVCRLGIAVACVAAEILTSRFSASWVVILFSGYTAYALATVFSWGLDDSSRQLPALIVDCAFLFIAIGATPAIPFWIPLVFYAYVVSVAVMMHERWVNVVVTLLTIVTLNFFQPGTPVYGVMFPSVVAGGLVAGLVAAERHLLKDRLAHASRQSVLHRYDAESARESERQRIAADFHDGPLQSFISFQMRLEVIRKLMSRDVDSAEEELTQLQEQSSAQIRELRTFVRSMRPIDVEGSLNGSLRRVIEQFQKDSGISTAFVSAEFVDPPDPEISLELVQIVREALYNIQKHSGATRVVVSIQKMEKALEISVEDNGNGFPFSGDFTLEELELLRLGPGSIKRRVRSLGAEMVLKTKPGQGSGLRVRLAT